MDPELARLEANAVNVLYNWLLIKQKKSAAISTEASPNSRIEETAGTSNRGNRAQLRTHPANLARNRQVASSNGNGPYGRDPQGGHSPPRGPPARLESHEVGMTWHTAAQRPNLPPRAMFSQMPSSELLAGAGRCNDQISTEPGYELLTPAEQHFCKRICIEPVKYLRLKDRIFERFHANSRFDEQDGKILPESANKWTKSQAQRAGTIDVNKISKVYEWYAEMGLWRQSWMQDTQ